MTMLSKYYWSPQHPLPISQFITKFRPSILTQDDGPWIWTSNKTTGEYDESDKAYAGTLGKGINIADNLVKRIREIENDASIPARGKKGVKSKKAVRDEELDNATQALKKLSIDSGWTVGKWLVFPRTDKVDSMWAKVSRSVAEGPLKEAGVSLAKVATLTEGSDGHVICIYMSNVYDKDQVTRVLEVLLTEHGIEPTGVKSDLYTLIGIDSHHPSKLRSTLWRPAELIEGGNEAVKQRLTDFNNKKTTDAPPVPAKKVVKHLSFVDDSDDEREKVKGKTRRSTSVEKTTTKSLAPVGNGTAKRSASVEEVVSDKGGPNKRAKISGKHKKSEAEIFKENDMFADSDDE